MAVTGERHLCPCELEHREGLKLLAAVLLPESLRIKVDGKTKRYDLRHNLNYRSPNGSARWTKIHFILLKFFTCHQTSPDMQGTWYVLVTLCPPAHCPLPGGSSRGRTSAVEHSFRIPTRRQKTQGRAFQILQFYIHKNFQNIFVLKNKIHKMPTITIHSHYFLIKEKAFWKHILKMISAEYIKG